jgi:integrase
MIHKPKGRRYYTIKLKMNGRDVQKRTRATTQKAALVIQAQIRTELEKGNFGILAPKIIPTVADFLRRDFLPFVANAKPGTRRTYEIATKRLLASSLAPLRLDEITSQRTAGFTAANAHRAIVTNNISLRTLRRALHLAVEWGRLPVVPKFPLLKNENQRERVLSKDEFGLYLAACRSPWRELVVLLYGTACRPGEIYTLRWENVALKGSGGVIRITQGKTKSAKRLLPMMAEVQAVLAARHHACGNPTEGWVFPAGNKHGHVQQSCAKAHAAAAKRAGLKRFPIYALRHSALTRLAESGCDAFTLARIAGHSSITITQKYCHPRSRGR